jgi:hypothetical protein
MRKAFGSRTLLAGMAGALLGALAQGMVNRIAGTTVITDGLMWGAVLAILGVSLPNFARMGALTVNSDKPLVNLLTGVGVFLMISLVIVIVFYFIFLGLERIL